MQMFTYFMLRSFAVFFFSLLKEEVIHALSYGRVAGCSIAPCDEVDMEFLNCSLEIPEYLGTS